MKLFFLTAGQAGAVDEESFIQAFEDVKKINIFNGRSVTEELNKIKEILTKTSNDWKLRMETCGNMRALLLAGAAQYDELFMGLKTLEVAFQNSVKDLRSQVRAFWTTRENLICSISFDHYTVGQKSEKSPDEKTREIK